MLLFLLLAAFWPGRVFAEGAPTEVDAVALARAVVELTNQERQKAGLLPLRWNDTLAVAGSAHARDMAKRNYFAHNTPEGLTPVERARRAGYPAYGWGGLFVGENLARGYSTAEAAVRAWMASEGHRLNMLDPKYRETGVGVATATNGGVVLAQEFGSSPKVLPVFINGDTSATDVPTVTLTVATENVSSWGSLGKIVQMMVSNRPDFADARWEPFAGTKRWVLKAETGPQMVYVRLKDDRGAVVESGDEILLTASPAVAATQREQGADSSSLQREPAREISAEPRSAPQSPSVSQPSGKPQFKLGFKLLANMIPEEVGDPIGNELHEVTGNSLQITTRGLLVWVRSYNWTAFTNGFRTWINGPFGLQDRLNGERFSWESR